MCVRVLCKRYSSPCVVQPRLYLRQVTCMCTCVCISVLMQLCWSNERKMEVGNAGGIARSAVPVCATRPWPSSWRVCVVLHVNEQFRPCQLMRRPCQLMRRAGSLGMKCLHCCNGEAPDSVVVSPMAGLVGAEAAAPNGRDIGALCVTPHQQFVRAVWLAVPFFQVVCIS
mgnify:CR=1 FL=1